MKKIFTFLLVLTAAFSFAQEPIPRQTVILEVGTGIW
jgi:hypothetical protein